MISVVNPSIPGASYIPLGMLFKEFHISSSLGNALSLAFSSIDGLQAIVMFRFGSSEGLGSATYRAEK